MQTAKQYIEKLLYSKCIEIAQSKKSLFDEFVQSETTTQAVNAIIERQNYIMDQWKIKIRIADIIALHFPLPNAKEKVKYQTKIDFENLGLSDLIFKEWQNLEEVGLKFNSELDTIEGTPTKSGKLNFTLLFKIQGEDENAPPNEKIISIIVNPDPKSLWKELPSDAKAIFWKADDSTAFGRLGDKNLIIASNRGRSHENVGSFRDDDYGFKFIEKTGWSVVTISDGAGSYALSRKGSEIACKSIIEYFDNESDKGQFQELEDKLSKYGNSNNENLFKDINASSKQILYKAVLFAHNKIKALADETLVSNPELFKNNKAKTAIEYFHATLIFVLFKKFEFGYVITTFGVGDCPIAVMNKEKTETTLLNLLDVGEFGGGTRFVTQADIFHSKEAPMATRFNLKILPDFSYLFLMTDGIYDPKFVVEANLQKHEKWVEFINDLQGENEDNTKVDLSSASEEASHQLSKWMDFWSAGNHDDRTLAIIF